MTKKATPTNRSQIEPVWLVERRLGTCPRCGGSGDWRGDDCPDCDGSGLAPAKGKSDGS